MSHCDRPIETREKRQDNDNDNDKDNDKDKDTDKVPETPDICYIFEILMTHSFKI